MIWPLKETNYHANVHFLLNVCKQPPAWPYYETIKSVRCASLIICVLNNDDVEQIMGQIVVNMWQCVSF